MTRHQALAEWLAQVLPGGDARPPALAPVTGDAGFRQYFRTATRPSFIGVDAPPEHEDTAAFVAKDLALRAAGVHVPRVLAVDFRRGFMLQEDLGDSLLLPLLRENGHERLYDAAETALGRIQRVPCDPATFPPYDRALLRREMALFPEWFAQGLLGLEPDAGERALLDAVFTALEDAALEQPQVVVHRDYHSRNLLLLDNAEIGVVDFQDAVAGPITYDLVSLLKDCYIRWPAAEVKGRALAFLHRAFGCHGLDVPSDEQLVRWFDLMGLQRHLKVLGIFARLWLRDGKPRYLDDLPLVLRYTLEVTGRYDELQPLHQWLTERLLPHLPAQSWYQPWEGV